MNSTWKAFGHRSACAPNEFGLQGPLAGGRPTPTWKSTFCVGGGRFQSAPRPSADGRPVRRMNSASEGLRPTVGLRRPRRCLLRRRRPTPGAERPERPISIGGKAFGRRPACAPNEFGLGRPSANGRPAPTGKVSSASAKADARRGAPAEADFHRREGLQPSVGLHRPGRCLLRRRRPMPGAQRPERPISIGGKAFGHRSACAPNEFDLGRPSAIGRPAPTGKVSSASAKADARRKSA
jgi:hypothetical protein